MMERERQLSLNDALNYVASVLRNHPEVSVARMRDISIAIEALRIDDTERLKRTILELAGEKAALPT